MLPKQRPVGRWRRGQRSGSVGPHLGPVLFWAKRTQQNDRGFVAFGGNRGKRCLPGLDNSGRCSSKSPEGTGPPGFVVPGRISRQEGTAAGAVYSFRKVYPRSEKNPCSASGKLQGVTRKRAKKEALPLGRTSLAAHGHPAAGGAQTRPNGPSLSMIAHPAADVKSGAAAAQSAAVKASGGIGADAATAAMGQP